MQALPLKQAVIYGPVKSRRLGRSLGINLLPGSCKVCSFDCVYCHFGRTDVKSLAPDEKLFPGVVVVLAEVERALREYAELEALTFSGNGEPTLHPQFLEIVAGVRLLRDRLQPDVKITLLSNASTASLPRTRLALEWIDQPILKLDAGDSQTLKRINRPAPAVDLEQLLEGLKGIPNLTIQTVLIDGKTSNCRGEAYQAWLAALSALKPAQVQLYSTDRPVAEAGVERVPPAVLERIAEEVERETGSKARAFWVAG